MRTISERTRSSIAKIASIKNKHAFAGAVLQMFSAPERPNDNTANLPPVKTDIPWMS